MSCIFSKESMDFSFKDDFSLSALIEFEKILGVELPEDYQNFLKQCNGGCPKNNLIKTDWKRTDNGYLSINLLFGLQTSDETDDIAYCREYDWIPEQMLYFGRTYMGESLYISLQPESFGQILCHDKKGELHLIASNFSGFWNLLEPNNGQDMVYGAEDYSEYFRENKLERFAKRIGYPLPEDYCHYLRTVNGGYPERTLFIVDGEEYILQSLFGINIPDDYMNLEWNYKVTKKYIPKGRVSIGNWEGGDLVLLGLGNEVQGKIFWQSHEAPDEYVLLCNSFQEFFDGLQEITDDI